MSWSGSGKPLHERFWSKVDRRGPDECWEWTGSRLRFGYGVIRYRGKQCKAHRICWELSAGAIPVGQCVRHACDNPACCNPAHLALGSNADNVADRVNRGRSWSPTGTENPRCRLSEDDVRAIRVASAARIESRSALAAKYGVSKGAINDIHHRRSWKHI